MTRDLTGTDSWDSLQELFYVMNATVDYVVLRNFECLPEAYTLRGHGDIDLLVHDYDEAVRITCAKRVFNRRNQ